MRGIPCQCHVCDALNNDREAPAILRNLDQSPTHRPAPRAGRGARRPSPQKLETSSLSSSTHSGWKLFVAPPSRGRGRLPDDRPAIAHQFCRQSRLHHPHHIGPDQGVCRSIVRCETHMRLGTPLRRSQRGQPSRAPLPSSPPRNLPERVHGARSSVVICVDHDLLRSYLARRYGDRSA